MDNQTLVAVLSRPAAFSDAPDPPYVVAVSLVILTPKLNRGQDFGQCRPSVTLSVQAEAMSGANRSAVSEPTTRRMTPRCYKMRPACRAIKAGRLAFLVVASASKGVVGPCVATLIWDYRRLVALFLLVFFLVDRLAVFFLAAFFLVDRLAAFFFVAFFLVDRLAVFFLRATFFFVAVFFFGHLDADRITFSRGRDVVLPGMSGPPLNYLPAGGYLEIDGAPGPPVIRTLSYTTARRSAGLPGSGTP